MIERERAKDLIIHPDKWTQWPFLPLVEGQGLTTKLGFLLDDPGDPYTVWAGNIFDFPVVVVDKLDKFDTLEELLNSDWEVN